MSELPLFETHKQKMEVIEKRIREKAVSDQSLQIVEAGCGTYWPIKLAGMEYEITGIDLDQAALNLRVQKYDDIDNVIIGDLRSVQLNRNAYDVVYSAFVLEHVRNAERVLDNFFSWLKPGGRLVLSIPDRGTVYGFVTRNTPLWFHVFFHKYIAKYKNSGKPGWGPYPTFYDKVVSRDGIKNYCARNNITVLEEYGEPFYLRSGDMVYVLVRFFVKAVAAISLGSLSWKHNNLVYVLEKSSRHA